MSTQLLPVTGDPIERGQLGRSGQWRVTDVREWPKELTADLAWQPSSFESEEDYGLNLTTQDIAEVHSAVGHFNSLGLYGSEVSTDNFPLPTLGPKLTRLAHEIHYGKGFAVIRRLDPEDFSPEDNVIVFLGISSYIGSEKGRQDEHGNMLMHVRDAKSSATPQAERPTRYSSRASTFHTDTFCDILALHTRSCAAEGGRNILASSWAVYNKLAARRPDLIELLAQPIWPFDTRGKFFECSTRPLLFFHGGRILLNFAREPLLGLQGVSRAKGLACLTPAQREALDVIEELAMESQLVLEADPGEMLFLNNHAILHSREAFWDTPETSRYLVRMWLRHPRLAWKLPHALQDGNDRIYKWPKESQKWNIVDVTRTRFRLSERLTS